MTSEKRAADPASNVVNNAPPKVRSLVISPNLDALLEYEDRTRGQTTGFSEPKTPELHSQPRLWPHSTAVPPSAESPIGLPPPPRRFRCPRSPPETRTKTNPLLPELVEAQSRENQENITPIPISPMITSTTSNPYINPAPTLDGVLHVGMLLEMSESGERGVAIDKKRSPTTQSSDGGQEPLEEQLVSALPRTRSRGKIAKHSLPAKKPAQNMYQTSKRQDTLISHGRQTSISSTKRPPSSKAENEPRISISSTIYSASSTQSLSHLLYNEPIPTRRNHGDSFMELYSAFDGSSANSVSPIQFIDSDLGSLLITGLSSKPPPKPKFSRATMRSHQPSPSTPPLMQSDLPPTTNFLDLDERADLVRKSKKLARLFGQTPGADAMAQQESNRSTSNAFLQVRSHEVVPSGSQKPHSSLPEPFGVASPRRHSVPLTPDDVSFLNIMPTFDDYLSASKSKTQNEVDTQAKTSSIDIPDPKHTPNQISSSPPTSFIDLSNDGAGAIKASPSSTVSGMASESLLETVCSEERKRKRERLAKLHRFLGSRVPANLVLGIDDTEASLPPLPHTPPTPKALFESDDNINTGKTWLKRRRSGPAALSPSDWNEDIERLKEELDDREKAINVRRAHKMEKVFGIAPPQTLYHTRQHPAPPLPSDKVVAPGSGPGDKLQAQQRSLNIDGIAYIKTKTKKNSRPGTSDSNEQLLGPGSVGFDEPTASFDTNHSLVYNHYQHSLISLNVILDRDDRESLAELHQYLNNNTDIPNPQLEDEPVSPTYKRVSISSSIKSERRRSLPASTSTISLASEYGINVPNAEITPFQLRRRRAAKLAQFFGVNYRELINEVLDSIENGVQHEQVKGTLLAEEVEDLLSKLRNLKTRRQNLF